MRWGPARGASGRKDESSARRVLLSGDLATDRGPARVNISFVQHAAWLNAPLDAPSLRLVWLLIFGRPRFDGAVVSSLSIRHAPLLVAGRLARRPVWYLAHGVAMREGSKPLSRRALIEWMSVRLAVRTVCVSEVLARDLHMVYGGPPERFQVVALGSDEALDGVVRAGVRPGGQSPAPINILTVGTSQIKNVDTIIRACRLLSSPHHLTVVGPLDVEAGYPTVLPFIPHRDLTELMHSVDVYIQASHHEPFGLAITEAASAGCELLVPANAGCVDYLSGMTDLNLIQDVTDIREVVGKLDQLCRRVQTGGAETHVPARSWSQAAAELEEVLFGRSAGTRPLEGHKDAG